MYPIGAVSKGQKGEQLAEFGEMKDAGIVAVSDDGRPVMNAELLRRAMEYARTFGLPLIQHCEDLTLSQGGAMNEGSVSTRAGIRAQPVTAESSMVARDIEICALTGARYHVAHVSSADSVALVREAKRRGLPVTCEVTPHHLTLTDDACAGYDTHAKCNPPLRSAADQAALREGLRDGTIDAIATDHAPHSPVEKDVEFEQAAFGMIGLETAVPLSLEMVRTGILSPSRFVALLSARPAAVLGLPGGTLSVGGLADVTVIDPEAAWTVDPRGLRSRSKNTPFGGLSMRGRAVLTIVGGKSHSRRRGLLSETEQVPALLAMEDGTIYRGWGFGAGGDSAGEIVFNTAITGYQEVITDPSYRGQIVTMTAPEIGNTGVNPIDFESSRPWCAGFVVRELSATVSNWRATPQSDLARLLSDHKIAGISGIDTRAITRRLRQSGAQRAVITRQVSNPAAAVESARRHPSLEGRDLVREVTAAEPYEWHETIWQGGGPGDPFAEAPPVRHHVVAYDFGIKRGILRRLRSSGCRVTVVPAATTAKDVLAHKPERHLPVERPGRSRGACRTRSSRRAIW